jgi:multidrug efflux pump subunit AcrA (membrane-fusion protein)
VEEFRLSRFLKARFAVIAVVIVAIVAAGGYFILNRNGATVQYRTAAAVVGTVTQSMPISGNLSPLNQTDLDFAGSGKVQAVNVVAGQTVTAGEVLASLDPVSLQGSLTQAQANLTSVQAKLSLDQAGATAQNLNQAQASVNTAQVQLQSDITSQSDTQAVNAQTVEQAKSAIDSAQTKVDGDNCNSGSPSPNCSQDRAALTTAQNNYQAAPVKAQQSNDQAQSQVNRDTVALQNAQASLAVVKQGSTTQQIQMDQSQVAVDQVNVDSAQRALNQTTLTAPTDGVVSQVSIIVGQTTSGSGSSSSGSSSSGSGSSGSGSSAAASSSSSTTHAISILTPGAYAVTGAVSDAQIGQIALGQAARITPAGATDALTGKVTYIGAVATVTSGVATFAVTVTIDGSNPALHAGTSASVSIIINQASEVLTIPTSALRGGSSVQVLVNGKAEVKTVTVGASDALRTQIVSGLNPGDQVITATVSSSVPTTNSGGGLFGGGSRGTFGGGGGGRGGGAVPGG